MKNLLLTIFVAFFTFQAFSQSVPQGMRYQAVARDEAGKTLDNENISLQISLRAGEKGDVLYTERHQVTTNQLGLFSITIGEGKTMEGEFASIPWSLANIWLDIDLQEAGGKNFTNINSSQLLTVPYAFHAGTADNLTGMDDPTQKNGLQIYWSTTGNLMTIPGTHYIGTKDYKDFNFGTNNIIRMSISKDGNIDIGGGLDIGDDFNVGNNVFIGNDLRVERDVSIGRDLLVERNTEMDGTLGVDGITTLRNPAESTTKDNGSLIVEGGVGIEKNVNIGGNTEIDGTLGVDGVSTFKNTTESTTKDNGSVVVEGGVGIEKNVNIGGNTEMDGTLGVDGITTLKNTTESTTKDNGSLIVEGGVGIEKNVNIGGNIEADGTLGVDGVTTLRNNLIVTKNEANYVAMIQNTNTGSGDGLLIRLGKARTPFTPPTPAEVIDAATQNAMVDLLRSDVSASDKATTLGNLLANELLEDLNTVVGLAIGTGNLIVNFINNGIGLPVNISDPINNGIGLPYNISTPINNGIGLPYNISAPINSGIGLPYDFTAPINSGLGLPVGLYSPLNAICDVCVDDDDLPGPTFIPALPSVTIPAIPAFEIPAIPAFSIPAIPNFSIPAIPTIPTDAFGFEAIDPLSLEFWGIPNLVLTDAAGNFLNNENEFVRFEDSYNVRMGSIRAVSISDFALDYLNPVFLYTLFGALTSSKIDKLHARYHFKSEIAKVVTEYIKLGVEYSSGAGDYAEWLERIDNKERIGSGDIVAVIGGKITKNLENAEQIMAVSHNPIVLGNIPADGKTHLGNNVAFMGQIPVKVLGPVATGDYIVAQMNTPGFGKAIHQNDMTIEDFKYAVGRAWGTNTNEGPKMINTVVGVHNGDYLKIIKRMENRMIEAENNHKASEARLNSLESKVDALLSSSTIVSGSK
ncbi:MAG: hypothetical protein IPI60_18220 [Saprospiraceae bacterium]|nr:hypothetical protein [Saprospiraceae bacterium]